MIAIKELSEETLWDIAIFCYRHPEREEEYVEGDTERFQEGYRRRADYLKRMLPQGARAQIAYEQGDVEEISIPANSHDQIPKWEASPDGDFAFWRTLLQSMGKLFVSRTQGEPVGFIEYYPIEVTNLELDGRGILAIWCISVREEMRGRGIGSGLIQACLDDARQLGRKGVAVTCWDPFWMPKAIFERHGFADVGPAGANGRILFKAFEPVDAPRWIEREPAFHPVEGKLALDLYYTVRCPIHWRNVQLVKEIAAEFQPRVEIREYSTDERADMRRYGTACRTCLNSRLIAAGPLADAQEVRGKFQEELDKLRGGRS